MKENWTYKKLGEVATFSRGLTYSKNDVSILSTKKVLRSNNIDLYSHTLDLNDIAYLKEEFEIPAEKILHKDDIFICMSNGSTQHLGKVAFIENEMDYAFGGFMGAIHPLPSLINPKFAFYACLSSEYRRFLASVLNGININNLRWCDLSNFSIPTPTLSEQQKIVSELDLLQAIIDKRQTQLKELDNLTLTTFYSMFGTSIDSKGWLIKKLGDIGTFQRGGGFLKTDFVQDGFPCIHYGQIHMKFGAFTSSHLTSIPKALALSKAKIAHKNDLIIAITSEDVEGSCKCTAWMGDYDIAIGAHSAIFSHNLNPIYVSYFFKSAYFNQAKTKYAHGFKVVEIKPSDIAKIQICIPPLSLQQSFADKIEAIEKQKANINKSIEETQKLFNYTMDKYFG